MRVFARAAALTASRTSGHVSSLMNPSVIRSTFFGPSTRASPLSTDRSMASVLVASTRTLVDI